METSEKLYIVLVDEESSVPGITKNNSKKFQKSGRKEPPEETKC